VYRAANLADTRKTCSWTRFPHSTPKEVTPVMTTKIRSAAPQQVTTGVVAFARAVSAWSGQIATTPTGSTVDFGATALRQGPAAGYAKPTNHRMDLTPDLGTRAWSPPV
jgi:hypothetical protein